MGNFGNLLLIYTTKEASICCKEVPLLILRSERFHINNVEWIRPIHSHSGDFNASSLFLSAARFFVPLLYCALPYHRLARKKQPSKSCKNPTKVVIKDCCCYLTILSEKKSRQLLFPVWNISPAMLKQCATKTCVNENSILSLHDISIHVVIEHTAASRKKKQILPKEVKSFNLVLHAVVD